MILAAIDGRSGAGKTTLASELEQSGDVLVFHMDDYYLPRSLHKPGIAGNMDLLRFRQEVLEPLRAGKPVKTRRFDCTSQQLCKEEIRYPKDLVIVEGAYSLHPLLRDFYDSRIFADIDSDTQKQRLLQRMGPEKVREFERVWIPREEAYLKSCDPKAVCDIVLKM